MRAKRIRSKYHVTYVTGAPASGKSTLCATLASEFPDTEHFSYSKELLAHVAKRTKGHLSETEIRKQSAQLISRKDVADVDRRLTAFVRGRRGKRHVLIDSHAVTKEKYGFRVTPFTVGALRALAPTLVVVLVVPAKATRKRIAAKPQGRPMPSEFEADFHAYLQSAVAFTYAFELGCRIYYLDARRSKRQLVIQMRQLLER